MAAADRHQSRCCPCDGVSAARLATGDAAISFDPLSSQGLLNALFTGLAAAEAAHEHLSGAPNALASYAAALEGIWRAYARQVSITYSAEARWPEAPFWKRRRPQVGY
jgi:flavin-dependent dehydrogenase